MGHHAPSTIDTSPTMQMMRTFPHAPNSEGTVALNTNKNATQTTLNQMKELCATFFAPVSVSPPIQ